MAALSDPVVQHVMGALGTMMKQIDAQGEALERTAKSTREAGNAFELSIGRALRAVEESVRGMQKNTPAETRYAEQITALNRTAEAVKLVGETIKQDVRSVSNDARDAAFQAVEQSKADALRIMQREATALMISGAMRNKVVSLAIGAASMLIVGLVAGAFGYYTGKNAGEAVGYAQARDETAAAAWSNTEDGKVAYEIVKSGMLSSLVRCNNKGWKTEGSVLCSPYAAGKAEFFGLRVK